MRHTYSTPDEPTSKDIDCPPTSANTARYEGTQDAIRLNSQGLPVGTRQQPASEQPGSFFRVRHEAVTPAGVYVLSRKSFVAWWNQRSLPAN